MSETTQLFTPAEIEYLKSQRLCRLATTGANGQPHVTPMGFLFNEADGTFDIGGHGGLTNRKKWRDVLENARVALVIDDVPSTDPWVARGIEIRGTAEARNSDGSQILPGFGQGTFHITPSRIVSWGIEGHAYGPPNARNVK